MKPFESWKKIYQKVIPSFFLLTSSLTKHISYFLYLCLGTSKLGEIEWTSTATK